jgi:hypothetical protein
MTQCTGRDLTEFTTDDGTAVSSCTGGEHFPQQGAAYNHSPRLSLSSLEDHV